MTKTECTIHQGFSGNVANAYKNYSGHTGIDSSCGFSSPIHALQDGYVYKVLTKENPANDGSGFTGVFVLVENEIEVFEMLYGHCNPIVTVGQYIRCGQVIGTEANNGEVYSSGVRITLDMQKNGDTRGSHRHDQKRPLQKNKTLKSGVIYLFAPNWYLYQDNEGYYYGHALQNGYAGCVDWTLPLFTRDLKIQMSGYDVQCLQKFLKWKGFLKIDTVTDFFGQKTRDALASFQKANGVSPTLGFCGQVTRGLINNIIN